jgi:predicted glycogen debranching enzyme
MLASTTSSQPERPKGQGGTQPEAPASSDSPRPSSLPIVDGGATIGRDRLEALGRSEWLLTNGLGGFAMGTVSGIPERRYHGWLIAATKPPLGRVLALHSCAESLIVANTPEQGKGETRYELSAYRFAGGTVHPQGLGAFQSFAADSQACHWHMAIPEAGIRVTRSLLLAHGANAASVRYTVDCGGRRARLEVRPFVALRDFHALLRDNGQLASRRRPDGIVEVSGGVAPLMLRARREDKQAEASFVDEAQWWRNFEYTRDRERGQDCVEDIFSPGAFLFECAAESQVVLEAWVPGKTSQESPFRDPWNNELNKLRRRANEACRPIASYFTPGSSPSRGAADVLPVAEVARAADQFVVRREGAGGSLTSIIAGYPWFSDWGRDTFISMRGLLLCTGRFKEALEVLTEFAALQRRGLVPNCFDDGSGEPEYNTVDGSLWFVHAACEYLRLSGDRSGFAKVRQACLNVVDAYRAGTDYDIRMDSDGLITAGGPGTQLTWMDAKRDGVVFTPRHGKPVEINALWYSGLMELATAIEPDMAARAKELRQVAEQTRRSFESAFWNPDRGCLNDVLLPIGGGWTANTQVRPNQIFALSQPHSPLNTAKQAAVLARVRAKLLTLVGLRTLDPSDPGYRPRYQGSLTDRDAAYHNGTVWPWLMGPYCEGVLRVDGFSDAAKQEVRGVLAPLIAEFMERRVVPGPVRQVAEIYDAEAVDGVRRPEGCIAQAWSVAELMRVMTML